MMNDESGANASAIDASTPDEQGDTEERSMEQLMAAADSAAEPATASASSSATPDKDSSTITIFNENSEVCCIFYLMLISHKLHMFITPRFCCVKWYQVIPYRVKCKVE